jgi:hypothetical protein
MLDPLCQLRQFDPGQVFLDGRIRAARLNEMFLPDTFDWALNAFVVRSAGRTMLIDAGPGAEFPDFPRAGHLGQRLQAAGIDLAYPKPRESSLQAARPQRDNGFSNPWKPDVIGSSATSTLSLTMTGMRCKVRLVGRSP